MPRIITPDDKPVRPATTPSDQLAAVQDYVQRYRPITARMNGRCTLNCGNPILVGQSIRRGESAAGWQHARCETIAEQAAFEAEIADDIASHDTYVADLISRAFADAELVTGPNAGRSSNGYYTSTYHLLAIDPRVISPRDVYDVLAQRFTGGGQFGGYSTLSSVVPDTLHPDMTLVETVYHHGE